MSIKVDFNLLLEVYVKILKTTGMSSENAYLGAKVLATADMWGDPFHGGMSLSKFVEIAKEGGMNPLAEMKVVKEGDSWAIVDGNGGLGHVTSCKAMDLAIQKAKKNGGISIVGVKNSMHFGDAGYYALMAAKEDMIGLAMSNVDPVMTVPGGAGRILGNNPLAYAVPAGKEKPVFLDIAMSKVAGGKLHYAKAKGESIPEGWAVDSLGNPLTDPSLYHKNGGALLPMAGHKGYGLALLVEILAGVITGAAMTKDISVWAEECSIPSNEGHSFMVINIESLMPLEEFKERMDSLIRYIKESPKAQGVDRIYLPGEMELEREEKARKEGVVLVDPVLESLKKTTKDLNMESDFKALVGK
ncbi:MAG: Ldh family oxidoreductase [Dehalococcoidia bacterium]|nr:Ldh family oxidoreductase [Dehalococcoidia bacterium]